MDDIGKSNMSFFEIDEMIVKKSIALYDQELSEMTQNFENLVTHCFAHGKRIYEQLDRLCEASAVRLPELARKIHMLKIELPEHVDEEIAKERMKTYMENEAQRLAQAIRSEQPRSTLIKKGAAVSQAVFCLIRCFAKPPSRSRSLRLIWTCKTAITVPGKTPFPQIQALKNLLCILRSFYH